MPVASKLIAARGSVVPMLAPARGHNSGGEPNAIGSEGVVINQNSSLLSLSLRYIRHHRGSLFCTSCDPLSCMHRGSCRAIYRRLFSPSLPSRQTCHSPFFPVTFRNRAEFSSLFDPSASAILHTRLRHSALKTRYLVDTAQRRRSSAMATAASGGDDDYQSRSQQSPLASQRAKQGNNPTEANRTGRFSGGYFPLGYKEGFHQWVGQLPQL